MKKNIKKKNYEKKNIYKKINILKDLKLLLLNVSFVMIYIIHKILPLLKKEFSKGSIFECFCKEYNKPLIFFKYIYF